MGHIPVRTCIACRRADAQRSLVRLTVVDGDVVVDRGDRGAGRGAYLCPTGECLAAALRRDGAALRRSLSRGRGPSRVDPERLTAQMSAAIRERGPARQEGPATAAGAGQSSATAGAVSQSATAGAVRGG